MADKPKTPPPAQITELTPEELNAKIALTGNLADLSPANRMAYYERYCKHLGLDPITRPFDLLTTFEENGAQKTILYANASCSAQLADKREVTYGKPELEYNEKLGLLTVRVQAMIGLSPGAIRSCWRSGVAHIEGLKGRRLENAIKKAETQAHRRATLALCGVAMPDESEIEDIPHSQTLSVDSAIGGVFEKIGELLRARNLEDSSGARRFILDGIASGNYQGVSQMIGIPIETIENLARHVGAPVNPAAIPTAHEIFDAPRPLPDASLPEAWTEDTAARRLADQEIANKINAGLKTISDQIAAEAPAPLPPEQVDQRAQQIAEAREKNIKPAEPDPVPALTPTLTASQQKVSDAVMLLFKEHKQSKAETLIAIEKFLGQPVKASKDLTDEEAEKVFAHLQARASELADKAKPPTKTKYGQVGKDGKRTCAHNETIGKALDETIKRLTILQVPFGPLSQEIADLIEREVSGRKIETRYELDDEEAQAALEFLQARILDREKEIEQKEAEAKAEATSKVG